MIDTSDGAIEADLLMAEGKGVNMGQIALARATIRATLRASKPATMEVGPPEVNLPDAEQVPTSDGGPGFLALPKRDQAPDIQIARGPYGDSFAVPAAASFEDRVTAAAVLLQLDADFLRGLLLPPKLDLVPPTEPVAVPIENVGPLDIEGEDEHDLDIDADFFAEAKAERRGRKR